MRSLHFHGVTLAATEDKQMAGERIFLESVLYQFAKAVERLRISVTPATSQIRVPDGRPIISSLSRSAHAAAQQATPATVFQGYFTVAELHAAGRSIQRTQSGNDIRCCGLRYDLDG